MEQPKCACSKALFEMSGQSGGDELGDWNSHIFTSI